MVKHMLLMATTFLAIASPAFGMEEADLQEIKEQKRRTILVTADLDAIKSLRVYQEPIGRCGRGEFFMPPQGYQYDYSNHRFSFSVQLNEPQLYGFSVSYTPFRTGFLNEELTYTHYFEANIPDGGEDITVQATLLSIALDSPASYGSSNDRIKKTIYKKG